MTRNVFGLGLAFILASCGESETSIPTAPARLTPQPVAQLAATPTDAFRAYSVADEVGKSFDMRASQIRDNRPEIEPGAAQVDLINSYVSINSDTEIMIVTSTGKALYFVVDTVNTNNPDHTSYQYKARDGGDSTLFVRRYKHGTIFGSFRNTELGAVSATLATFGYGFRTDPANLPTTIANFEGLGPNAIYFSDGHRMSDGRTTLTADFANSKISGTLFNNAHFRQEGLIVDVQLNDGQINADGTITARDTISMTIDDSANPGAAAAIVSNSTGDGQFTGSEAIAVTGHYTGAVNSDGNDLEFVGSFWAQNQDPRFGLGLRP